MKRKIAVITVLAVFILSCASFAQRTNGMRRGGIAGKRANIGRLSKQLNLTQDQIKSIDSIIKKFHADIREIEESSAVKEEKQSKIKALRQSASEEIMNVLNAEQRAKAEKMKLIGRLLTRGPASPLFGILSKLNLTDKQKTSIDSIMKESTEKIKAIKQDTTLTTETRQARCKEIRESSISRVKEQLTLDQLKKFNELFQNPRMRTKNSAI
ncbi:hypothetical protein LLG46_10945 [bacterium]|nr:hypothetical protein [bacterium]